MAFHGKRGGDIIVRGFGLWPIYRPLIEQLKSLCQILATIGVNISPFIDLKIGANSSTVLGLEDIGSFCILRLENDGT